MPRLTRSGVTLVDLLVALALLGALGAIMVRLLLLEQRNAARLLAADQARQVTAEAAAWLGSELVDLGRSQGPDLLVAAPESLAYRASRATGVACEVTATEVLIERDRWSAWRMPQPSRDSLLLFVVSDSAAATGHWITAPVLAVGTGACSGRPALRIATLIADSLPAFLPALIPTRVFEVMQAKYYRSLGQWWIGAQSLSGADGLQPVTGPFVPLGVRFSYESAPGRAAASRDSIRTIALDLTAEGGTPVRLRLQPRNVP